MRAKYFVYGGQPIPHAYRWKGFPSLATRVASDTRGLSGVFDEPHTEYLPYRASGPEPLDPGELGHDGIGAVSDLVPFLLTTPTGLATLAGVVGLYFLLRKKR